MHIFNLMSPFLLFSIFLFLQDLPILNVNIPFYGGSVIGLYTRRDHGRGKGKKNATAGMLS
jgi:hypothetical protein